MVIVFVFYVIGIWPFNGVNVIVDNTGITNYISCSVAVAGGDYDLGPLDVGHRLSTAVCPTSDSSVVIRLIEDNGVAHVLTADCYFGPRGYSGTVTVQVADDTIVHVDNDVGFGFP
tara:strand:+ start:2035 stop:2382 length:348 start_codon:yes stop_codon:yes gene_type:complete